MFPFSFSKGGLPKWMNEPFLNTDIHKYVQDIVEKSMQQSAQYAEIVDSSRTESEGRVQAPASSMAPAVFESHDHVYVRIFIKKESGLANLKIYHNANQLFVEGIPEPEDRNVIPLPSAVKMRESTSEYRDGFLQIKMKKRNDSQYTEIAIPPIE